MTSGQTFRFTASQIPPLPSPLTAVASVLPAVESATLDQAWPFHCKM